VAALVEDDQAEARGERLEDLLDAVPAGAETVREEQGRALAEHLDREAYPVRSYVLQPLGHPLLPWPDD
jgi:hypothetical protein